MILSKAFAAVLTGAGLVFQNAIAHSVRRNPLSYITRIDDAVIHTPSHRVHAHTPFVVTFLLHGGTENVRLALEPNHDIFSGDATIQYTEPDGSIRKIQPVDRRAHRVFRGDSFVRDEGQSEWKHVGWARINVRRDGDQPIFEGVFTIGGINHHVQTSTKYRQTAVSGDPELSDDTEDEHMVVWRDSDVTPASHDDLKRDLGAPANCGSDQLRYNRDENNIVYRGIDEPAAQDTTPWAVSPRFLFGRQMGGDTVGGNGPLVNLADSIGSTAGCPNTRRIALVGIATDCTYTAELGSDEAVTDNVVQLVNSASQLYESTFNISLAIQNLTISPRACPSSPPPSAPWNTPCSNSIDITERLSLFSQWRGQWRDTNAYWTLLTTCGTENAVGLAWLGAVCQQGSTTRDGETSASANVVVRSPAEWLVFAHETGHTFGAVHDCTGTTCADGTVTRQGCCPLTSSTCDARGRFVMNPSTGEGVVRFSACSIGNICSFLGRASNRVSCLTTNRGVTSFSGSQCGNGIVETGEDCDCGGEEGCRGNTCCNPQTCKYTTGSQCDPTNEECCTSQCRFASRGSVCRPSAGPCDPQEVCPGDAASCPADESMPDGESCGNPGDGLTCASGRCTSRTQQCRVTWGVGSAANDTSTNSCEHKQCIMSCSSPRFKDLQCYNTGMYFLDGTPCEAGGRCRNGNCEGVSLAAQFREWIDENKEIFIPVVTVVGLIVLLCFASCIWSCFRRRRAPAPRRVVPPRPLPRTAWSAQYFGAGGAAGPGGDGMSPMRPGPAYAQLPPQDTRWEPMRATSFRYA